MHVLRYIAWEKNNPMRSDDNSLIKKRVVYAYEQALLTWGHHPDIWYEAALFLERSANLVHEKGDTQVGRHFTVYSTVFRLLFLEAFDVG